MDKKGEKLINLPSQDHQKGKEDACPLVAAVELSSTSNTASLQGEYQSNMSDSAEPGVNDWEINLPVLSWAPELMGRRSSSSRSDNAIVRSEICKPRAEYQGNISESGEHGMRH